MRSEPTFATLLSGFAIGALWTSCVLLLGSSPGFGGGGHILVAVVLLGMTAAMHRLFRQKENGWLIAMALAPVVAVIAIGTVAVLNHLELI